MEFFDDVWVYTLAMNSWSQVAYTPLPQSLAVLLKRSFHSGVLVGGTSLFVYICLLVLLLLDTLYVFGGYVAALQTSGNDLWTYSTIIYYLFYCFS